MTKQEKHEIWAVALDLNNGKEGRGQMRINDLRCCLAVAEDVWRDATGSKAEGGSCNPCNECLDWFGWKFNNPRIGERTFEKMNDQEELSHSEIAKIVRNNWKVIK